MREVRLSGRGVTIAEAVAVARGRAPVVVDDAVFARLERARAVLDAAASAGQRIYGLNTGLGGNLGTDIRGDASAFQSQLLEGRSGAMGAPLATDIVRATMMARACMLSAGGSGISPAVFEALIAALNAGVHPMMPSLGSIGAGDLVLMTAMARLLIGEGDTEYGGQSMPASAALEAAGLAPVRLAPKDGLSLINASAVSVGHATLAVADARTAFAQQQQAAALTLEGIGANLGLLDARLQKQRPAFGQEEAAAGLRALLAGAERPEASAIQDPLSIRCIPSIHGALLAAIDSATAAVEIELNATSDNPVVISGDGVVMSTGNFDTSALALAFETLGLAIAQAAHASVARLIQMTGAGRNGLPKYLSPIGGASAGFVPLQKTATAILAAIRHRANPVMLDFLPVSEGVEDHATQAPLVIAKCAEMIGFWQRLIALEMLAAAQAVDLRGAASMGVGTAKVHAAIRAIAAPLGQDRPLGGDAEALYAALSSGKWQA